MTASPTSKILALVVDDEPLARSNLTALLRADPQIDVRECASGADAIAEIRTQRPDVLFIDVQMPEIDGFDVLEMVGGDLPPAVIFVTAFDQYALRAFEAGALDYLLKPFDNARFERALARAKSIIEATNAGPGRLQRIPVKTSGGILFLKDEEIDWIEAADYYACLHVQTKSYLLRRSMSDLEHDLDPLLFCRVHRSAIVNLHRVKGLSTSRQGELEVILEDEKRLPLSRRYRQQLQERLGLRG
jgi:two-component system, LytTR family, response regulator